MSKYIKKSSKINWEILGKRYCTKCKMIHNITEFHKSNKYHCRNCINGYCLLFESLPNFKYCNKCKVTKQLKEFGNKRTYCKECEVIKTLKFRDKDKFITYQKQYKINNKESIAKYKKEYAERNIDKIKTSNVLFLKNNREAVKKYNKQYKIDNAEELKRYSKQYYLDKKLKYISEKLENGANDNDYTYYEVLFTHKKLGFKFLKVGITSNTVEDRYSRDSHYYDYEILNIIYGDKEYIKALEMKTLMDNENNKFIFPKGIKFGGYTECINTYSSLF